MISCPDCGNADTDLIFNGMAVQKCLSCGAEWRLAPPAKTVLTFDKAMAIARHSFAESGNIKDDTPSPYITMTSANLVKFFQLASERHHP